MTNKLLLVGESPQMRSLREQVGLIAKTDATVMIRGEVGSGREHVARVIHEASARSGKPFVSVHCGAVPDTLLKTELFGTVKADRLSMWERARGGTILLKEFDKMALPLQAVFLRFLQDRTPGDPRVIVATSSDLVKKIALGTLREDLYYRVNVIPVTLSPLRERPQDIPALFEYLCIRHQERHRLPIEAPSWTTEAQEALTAYPWPGNIRELDSVVAHFVLRWGNGVVTLQALPPEIRNAVRAEIGSDFEITLSPEFSGEEVKALLTALANYYRDCGGLGLLMTFEAERVAVEDRVSA